MISVVLGILLIAFTVFACLPLGLGWGWDVVAFLKGFAPVLTAFIGLIILFIGIGDIKDKKEAKKEEMLAKQNAKNTQESSSDSEMKKNSESEKSEKTENSENSES